MKIFNIKQRMIFLICLFQIILTKNQDLNRRRAIKPFISVLSPDSMKQYEKSPEKKESKFLQKEEFKPFISVAPRDPLKIFLSEEELSSDDKKDLPAITFSVKCMYVDDYNLYDIRNLGINTVKTDKGGYVQSFQDENIDLYYNFCYDLKLSKIPGCENLNVKTQIVAVKNGTCQSLAGSINKGNTWSILDLKDSNNKTERILQIELNRSEKQKQKIYYQLKCNENVDINVIGGKCKYGDETYLFIETKEACVKADFYLIWKFINDYVAIFALVLIAFGFFNCILGKKFAKFTSFLLTLFSITILVLIFSQYILPSGCAQWIIWVMLILGIILGSTAGYFVFKNHEKFLSFLVGGVAGFFLGEFLFNLFGNAIPGNLTVIHILFVVVCILVLIIVAFFLKNFIVIFATSFIGAYTLIRGISLFAGYFPSEFTVIDLKQREEFEQLETLLTWRVYVYLASMVVATGLSIFIQFKINKEEPEKDPLKDES